MATAQLFSYEKFPSVMSGYWLLGDQATVHLFAAGIVSSEVFALPFLLRMKVSPLMRALSMVCSGVVAITWLVVSLWAVTTVNGLTNGGLLGATVRIAPGIIQLGFSIILFGLIGYVGWQKLLSLRTRD
jgi:hypothetical protein